MRRTIRACVLWVAAVLAVESKCFAADEWVVPPGREALLAEMLGKDQLLPGDCRFTGGGVRYTTVEATYGCSAGEVVIELTHPSAAGVRAVRTQRFAIEVRRGSPSPELLAELILRIRLQEAAFEWQLQTGSRVTATRSALRDLLGVSGIAAVAWVLWRYRSRARLSLRRIRPALPGVLQKLALVVMASGIGFALSEIAVRRTGADARIMNSALLFQQSNPEVHRVADDWFLHFDLRPGARVENVGYWGNRYHMTIDEFGARAPTHPGRKGPGVFRILCFGGSTMYGADVSDEETIPAALERRLNAEEASRVGVAPRRFEAWNFGTHAYVLSQAAHRARTELIARDPDLILVQLHNIGPRAFFLEPGADRWATLREFEMDPHLLPENFPPPALMPSPLHSLALRYSAAYRLLVGFLRRHDRTEFPYAEELSRNEARALAREAAERDVPLVFFSIPSDGDGPVADTVYPELPEEQFINFYEPGREADYYMMHPPARFLDEYAGQLIEILRRRDYLPSGPIA